MEHSAHIPPEAATDEPASPSTPVAPLCRAAVSNRLEESLIEPALDAGRDPRPGRAGRRDGWTRQGVRTFLEGLAAGGCVTAAARAAGMTRQSAYQLRNRNPGGPFDVAWNAAEQLARNSLAGALMSRAMHGCVEVYVRDGKVEERHRFDNRHSMAVLTRLDRRSWSELAECRKARLAAQRFDEFLDIVCAGGGGAEGFFAEAAILAEQADIADINRRRRAYAAHGIDWREGETPPRNFDLEEYIASLASQDMPPAPPRTAERRNAAADAPGNGAPAPDEPARASGPSAEPTEEAAAAPDAAAAEPRDADAVVAEAATAPEESLTAPEEAATEQPGEEATAPDEAPGADGEPATAPGEDAEPPEAPSSPAAGDPEPADPPPAEPHYPGWVATD